MENALKLPDEPRNAARDRDVEQVQAFAVDRGFRQWMDPYGRWWRATAFDHGAKLGLSITATTGRHMATLVKSGEEHHVLDAVYFLRNWARGVERNG